MNRSSKILFTSRNSPSILGGPLRCDVTHSTRKRRNNFFLGRVGFCQQDNNLSSRLSLPPSPCYEQHHKKPTICNKFTRNITAFDPSTKSNLVSVSLNWDSTDNSSNTDYSDDQGDWLRGHVWKADGSKLFVINWDGGLAGDTTDSYRIISYDASTPFEISTISNSAPTSSTSFDPGSSSSFRDLAMSSDGTKFFFIDKSNKFIVKSAGELQLL